MSQPQPKASAALIAGIALVALVSCADDVGPPQDTTVVFDGQTYTIHAPVSCAITHDGKLVHTDTSDGRVKLIRECSLATIHSSCSQLASATWTFEASLITPTTYGRPKPTTHTRSAGGCLRARARQPGISSRLMSPAQPSRSTPPTTDLRPISRDLPASDVSDNFRPAHACTGKLVGWVLPIKLLRRPTGHDDQRIGSGSERYSMGVSGRASVTVVCRGWLAACAALDHEAGQGRRDGPGWPRHRRRCCGRPLPQPVGPRPRGHPP